MTANKCLWILQTCSLTTFATMCVLGQLHTQLSVYLSVCRIWRFHNEIINAKALTHRIVPQLTDKC